MFLYLVEAKPMKRVIWTGLEILTIGRSAFLNMLEQFG
jgi:hypothetical protein